MGIIYQLTFFLALGLLAIVITIFVFAVSLLGRALEVAAREQEKTTKEQKEATEKEIAAIQKQISALRKKGRIDKEKLKELEKKLKQLRKQEEKFEKKLGRIGKAPELLTVKGGVAPCGALLLGALILTGLAWYLADIQIPIGAIHVIIWGLGLVAIGYTIFHIYRCLRVIESVAIISEEAALRKTVEAFKVAQKELEKEKRPELELYFEDEQPPFHMTGGAQKTIEISLGLVQGDIARKSEVYFLAPPGFEFPKRETWVQRKSKDQVGGYLTTQFESEDVRKGVTQPEEIIIKAPSGQGKFTLYYRLTSEEFDSGYEGFEVIVEESKKASKTPKK